MGRRGPAAAATAKIGDESTRLECPGHLSDAAKAVWRSYVPKLARLALLMDIDAAVLESFCVHRAQWLDYTARLAALDPTSQEHARLTRTASTVAMHWMKAVNELGLSPNARARMRLESPEAVKDELKEFLEGK